MGINLINMIDTLGEKGYITGASTLLCRHQMKMLKEDSPIMYSTVCDIVEGVYKLGVEEGKSK